jgi:hypothetical protein
MVPTHLEMFEKEYNGLLDHYLVIFELLKKAFHPHNVLYPGSYCHITPSLVFPRVVYVDNFKKIRNFFDDKEVVAFIQKNKKYKEKSKIHFYFTNYQNKINEPLESFDLLISLNAGLISTACKKYLKKGGMLLANDEHYDARTAFVDDNFQFTAAYDKTRKQFNYSEEELKKFFITKKNIRITPEMIKTSLEKPPSKDPFKPKNTSAFYLFTKK